MTLWISCEVRNFVDTGYSFNLQTMNYDFFHDAAKKGFLNQIEAFNLTKRPTSLLKKHSSGESVFLILFKEANYEFLMKYLDNMGSILKDYDTNLLQINKRNKTFLHLLLQNKK